MTFVSGHTTILFFPLLIYVFGLVSVAKLALFVFLFLGSILIFFVLSKLLSNFDLRLNLKIFLNHQEVRPSVSVFP